MNEIPARFKLDREKYLRLVKSKGLSAAITALHHDKEELEMETFEGQKGYQRAYWDYLEEFRQFSRDLWDQVERTPSA